MQFKAESIAISTRKGGVIRMRAIAVHYPELTGLEPAKSPYRSVPESVVSFISTSGRRD